MGIWNYQDLIGLRHAMVLPHGADDLRVVGVLPQQKRSYR